MPILREPCLSQEREKRVKKIPRFLDGGFLLSASLGGTKEVRHPPMVEAKIIRLRKNLRFAAHCPAL